MSFITTSYFEIDFGGIHKDLNDLSDPNWGLNLSYVLSRYEDILKLTELIMEAVQVLIGVDGVINKVIKFIVVIMKVTMS